jgi:hypothetical protein
MGSLHSERETDGMDVKLKRVLVVMEGHALKSETDGLETK